MANQHAHKADEELKKHGDVLEEAMHDADRHNVEGQKADPVPMPDNGSHSHSQAAHLGSAHGSTKPAGNLRQGASPGQLREPPQDISRVGKQHRGQ